MAESRLYAQPATSALLEASNHDHVSRLRTLPPRNADYTDRTGHFWAYCPPGSMREVQLAPIYLVLAIDLSILLAIGITHWINRRQKQRRNRAMPPSPTDEATWVQADREM